MFRMKEKIPDVGKDTFRTFLKKEQTSTQAIESQLSAKKQSEPPTTQQTVSVLPSAAQMILEGSLKSIGSSYDAMHLDKFLMTSEYASLGKQIQIKQTSESPSKSCFFRSKLPRISDVDNTMKKSSPYNCLVVLDSKPNEQRQKYLQKRMLQIPEKKFQPEYLHYSDLIQSQIQSPKDRQSELENVKKNKEEYQKWKQDYGNVNRSYKLAKRHFKSGILNLDNPEASDSILYKEEQERYSKSIERQENHSKERKKIIEKFTLCNPSLEFSNKAENGDKFPNEYYQYHQDWNKKKVIFL